VVKLSLQLTQKEQTLLKDQLNHEKICVDKYGDYAQKAQDSNLQQMFQQFSNQERQHYNTINQMLSGQQPSLGGQQGQSQQQMLKSQQGGQTGMAQGYAGATSQDAMLCQDMLMTEKYVSGAYDTTIFESAHPEIRQALQHIQKEEQQHGEGLFNYLQQNGMYTMQ